jgi:hypothetical protein
MTIKVSVSGPATQTLASSLNSEERMQRIKAMGQRIVGYVESMCQPGDQGGSSAEATEKAVTAFYERMLVVESQLRKIHDDFRLE